MKWLVVPIARIGASIGIWIGYMISRSDTDRASNCAPLVCEQGLKGRYLDGRCYDASGLKEVKP
jgi:hypothetical protein